MIGESTVFILGAGSSVPYGYPTADKLRHDIITSFKDRYKEFLEELKLLDVSTVNNKVNKVRDFIHLFKESGTKSIDLYLSRNENLLDVGKNVLTLQMLFYERDSKFNEDMDNPKFDWYSDLFTEITNYIISPNDLKMIKRNNISFITFNYDRSLEHYLHKSLKYSFSECKEREIKDAIENFNFIHVYGKIADLNWEDSELKFQYKDKAFVDYFEALSKNIRVIYDDRNKQAEEIQNEIYQANRIFFLGFGFAEENLDAIEFKGSLKPGHSIFATTLGFTPNEVEKIKDSICGNNTPLIEKNLHFVNCDSRQLLKDYL